MTASQIPGRFVFKTAFFKNFPDWTYAKALGDEEVYIHGMSLPSAFDCNEKQQRAVMDWLARARWPNPQHFHESLEKLRIKEIQVDDAMIFVSFAGAIANYRRLEGTLKVLRALN